MARSPKKPPANPSPTGPSPEVAGAPDVATAMPPPVPPAAARPRRAQAAKTPPPPPPDDIDLDDVMAAEDEDDDDSNEPDFADGVGVGEGPPDLDRIGGHSPVPMRPVEREVRRASTRVTEGPLGTDTDDLEPMAKVLSRFGSRFRVRVRRLFPDDMPPNELAQSSWIDVPGADGAPHEIVRDLVARRFGGGRFEVAIADHDPSEFHKNVTTTLDLPGDPIPSSHEGRRWFQQRYGYIPPTPQGLDGKPLASAAGVPTDGSIASVLSMLLQQSSTQQERLFDAANKDKDREAGLVPHLLQFAQGQRMGIASLVPVLPVVLEFIRMMREDRARDREAAEARYQGLLTKLSEQSKPQTAPEVLQSVQTLMGFTSRRLEMELEMTKKQQQMLLEETVRTLRDGGREEEAGLLATLFNAVKANAPDLVRLGMPMLAGALQAAGGGGPQSMAPRQIAAGPRPAPGAAAPAAPRPGVIRTGPVRPAPAPASTPAAAPPAAPQVAADFGPPPASPTAPPAPVDAPPAAPEPQPEAPAVAAAPQLIPPAGFGAQLSMSRMVEFLQHVLMFAEAVTDPDSAWDYTVNGNSMEVLFGMSPPMFRQRVEATDPEKPFLVSAWVEGAPPQVVELGQHIDALISASGESRSWLCAFLEVGPWVEGEEDVP